MARNHYASSDIKDRLLQLTSSRSALLDRWDERWENLQLSKQKSMVLTLKVFSLPPYLPHFLFPFSRTVLEVYQFARDAAVAEAWLIAQESYLFSSELGHTIDEVENLIKKHEAFEKSAAAQEERFIALRRLTTVSSFHLHFH